MFPNFKQYLGILKKLRHKIVKNFLPQLDYESFTNFLEFTFWKVQNFHIVFFKSEMCI